MKQTLNNTFKNKAEIFPLITLLGLLSSSWLLYISANLPCVFLQVFFVIVNKIFQGIDSRSLKFPEDY